MGVVCGSCYSFTAGQAHWNSKVLAFVWVWLHKVTGIMFLLFSSGCTWAFFVWDWLHIGIGLNLGLHAHKTDKSKTYTF